MDQTKRLEKLEKDFFKEWLHRKPLLGTALGFHDDYDDKMPDGSLERQLDDIKFLQRTLSEFEKVEPKKLAPLQAVSRDFAIHLLKNWIFDRDVLRFWETQPEAPTVLGQSIFQILSRNYAPLGQRMRAIMKRLEKMPKYIDASRSRLRTPVKQFVEIELEQIPRRPGFFNLLKDIGRDHLPETPQRDVNRLIDQTQNALERYSDWLIVDVLPDCKEEYAIGEDRFKKLLQVRGLDVSPGHIASVAEAEIDKIKERQKEVARAIKRKTALEDIRDMIKQQHSENFDGVLRFVRESVQEMGHDDTPPSRFMQMQSMILASVRVMIDAKISTGKMTYQQSIETLIDYLGMDRVCAEAETRRFVVQPGVPTLHWWGREKMKDLRKWAKDKMETRFTH